MRKRIRPFTRRHVVHSTIHLSRSVLEAAEATAESNDPIMMLNLSAEDKWQVLNTCTNRLSAQFGTYHVFFNEARRTDSHYRSAWYCFTLTCSRTQAGGRCFITPFNECRYARKGIHLSGGIRNPRFRLRVRISESRSGTTMLEPVRGSQLLQDEVGASPPTLPRTHTFAPANVFCFYFRLKTFRCQLLHFSFSSF